MKDNSHVSNTSSLKKPEETLTVLMKHPPINVTLSATLSKLNIIKYNLQSMYFNLYFLLSSNPVFCRLTLHSRSLFVLQWVVQTHTLQEQDQDLIFTAHDAHFISRPNKNTLAYVCIYIYTWKNVWHTIITLIHKIYFDICHFIFNANFYELIN